MSLVPGQYSMQDMVRMRSRISKSIPRLSVLLCYAFIVLRKIVRHSFTIHILSVGAQMLSSALTVLLVSRVLSVDVASRAALLLWLMSIVSAVSAVFIPSAFIRYLEEQEACHRAELKSSGIVWILMLGLVSLTPFVALDQLGFFRCEYLNMCRLEWLPR
jgi:O-antigen/teichoic acid export membrane protein